MDTKDLFNYHGTDFEVWESPGHGKTSNYHLSVEGYVGYDELSDFIELYKSFLGKFEEYLIKNNYEKNIKHNWKCVYQTREIDISYEHECYWVFLTPPTSDMIWDLYYYMDDVIKQIEGFIEQQNDYFR